MAGIAFDNFDTSRLTWTPVRSTTALTINADGTASLNSTTNNNVRAEFDCGSADMFAEVEVRAAFGDADRSAFVMTRCVAGGTQGTTATTYYALLLNANKNIYSLLKYSSGTATAVADSIAYTPPATPFKVRLESEGSTHRIKVNGALIASYTDATITAGSMGGIGAFNGGTVLRFDNFRTGALSVDRYRGQFFAFMS